MVEETDLQRLEKLQEELSARQSVLHFSHAAVSMILALILAGAAAKLFWDSIRVPILGWVASAVSIGCAWYSVSRYRVGRRAYRDELARFESMKALRSRLGLG
jgi:hypothetical protein